MREKARKNSISLQIILVVIALILPLNLLSIFQANTMIQTVLDEVTEAEQNTLESYALVLESRMDNAVSMLYYYVTEDSDCLSMARATAGDPGFTISALMLYASVKRMQELSDGATGYFFYFPKAQDTVFYGENYIGMDGKAALEEYLQGSAWTDEVGQWLLYEEEDTEYVYLIISSHNVIYGAWIDLTQIKQSLVGDERFEVMLLQIEDGADTAKAMSFSKDSVMISASAKNLTLTLFLSKEEIISANAIYQRLLLIMAFLYLLVIPLLYWFIRRIFINPLNQINYAHSQIQAGNGDFRLSDQAGSAEFTRANRSFNLMADNIHALKIASYEDQLEKQRMELRNLQLQIRPHFLQNTFNLIFVLAQKKNTEAIQKIILYLSNYFRTIARSEKGLELFSKEMELIEGYVQMANYRYDGLIDFMSDLDPELEFLRTPPLLIHNFVENAVKYGLKQGEVLHINLEGRYDNRIVTFTIFDDGNGMRKEMLEYNQKLFRRELEPEDKSAHQGLYNSLKRLTFFYGEEASIEVESVWGEMTCFTIRFPYNLEMEDAGPDF